MNRLALVVGINTYDYEGLRNLTAPAEDAEAIAQLLTEYGNFQVERLPSITTEYNTIRTLPTSNTRVTLAQLEEALVQLFQPEGNDIPDTALLYFSGYGLHKDRGIQTDFLATSDINPNRGNWGLSVPWLRRLLQNSPVRQQIIWLDCCCSDEEFNLAQADPGYRGKGKDRCFIATSYAEFSSDRLTKILLPGLNPTQHPNRWITNYSLVNFINQESILQPLIFANSGNPILLTATSPEKAQFTHSTISIVEDVCPYKGLAYFDCNDTDPNYFYGRTTLTDQLIEQVRQGNFLAVLGASGTGKSSLLRAGLIHQLKLGQRLSGSHQWPIYIFRPGEDPRRNLALAFINPELSDADRSYQLAKTTELIQMGAVGLTVMVRTIAGEGRVVLVIDQFEDVFTVCQDETERQQFFTCLLEALERTDNKLCVVIGMRTDVLDKCAERDYAGLAHKIQANLVTMTPMNREELRQAIIEPAKQVGLEVESGLVTQILTDLQGSANLPLLQYTLTELWQRRPVNKLMLAEYARLGGIQGAIQKRANLIYQSLSVEEREVAKQIFLELTQLNQEIHSTGRPVLKDNLVKKGRSPLSQVEKESSAHLSLIISRLSFIKTNKQPTTNNQQSITNNKQQTTNNKQQTTNNPSTELIEQVLQKLVNSRLLVTGERHLNGNGNRNKTETVVDIVHEALIRDWSRLHQWLDEKREATRIQEQIEDAAEEWHNQGILNKTAFLLQGLTLAEAQNYLQNHSIQNLSSLAQEFLSKSIQHHRNQRWFQIGGLAILIGVLSIVSVVASTQWQRTQRVAEMETLRADAAKVKNLLDVDPLKGLMLAIEVTGESQSQFQQIPNEVESSLIRAIDVARETNLLLGHRFVVSSVAFSPDNQILVSGSYDGTLRLWSQHGKPIGNPLRGHQSWVTAVAFSPDGQTIVSSGKEGTIRLWTRQGKAIGKPFQGQQDWITSVAFSPDGQTIASGGKDGTVRLWTQQGKLIGKPFKGHQGVVFTVAFSPDGQTIASSSGDGTIRLWNRQGQPLGQPLRGHEGVAFAVAFSPDGQTLVSGGRDGSVRLWNRQGKPIAEPFRGHEGVIFAVAFSPDGQTIVSGSGDNTVRLWNRQSQPLGEPLRGHKNAVLTVAFSPDGQRIASGSKDGTVRLWDWQNSSLPTALQEEPDWQTLLELGCDRLRDHPIFQTPQSSNIKSRNICQEQVWGKE